MITIDEIMHALAEARSCRPIPEGFLVGTDCLYPSNALVQVEVQGDRRFVVSDRGGALDTLVSHGVELGNPIRALTPFASARGLKTSNSGAIYATDVSMDTLPLFILMVANASKDVATSILEKHSFSLYKSFKEELRFDIEKRYEGRIIHNYSCPGQSNKIHVFDHAISKRDKGMLLLDSAIDEGNSINSIVVSNLDVSRRNDPDISQAIIYDDRTQWRAESLSLLEEGGAVVLAYSGMIQEIDRLIDNEIFSNL